MAQSLYSGYVATSHVRIILEGSLDICMVVSGNVGCYNDNDDSVLLKEQCGCERYFMNYDM